jgi:hypothetical protein
MDLRINYGGLGKKRQNEQNEREEEAACACGSSKHEIQQMDKTSATQLVVYTYTCVTLLGLIETSITGQGAPNLKPKVCMCNFQFLYHKMLINIHQHQKYFGSELWESPHIS